MVKLYFKSECTKFINFNEDTGEPDEKGDATPANPQKPSISGAEELPPVGDKDVPPADNAEEPPFDVDNNSNVAKNLDDEIFG